VTYETREVVGLSRMLYHTCSVCRESHDPWLIHSAARGTQRAMIADLPTVHKLFEMGPIEIWGAVTYVYVVSPPLNIWIFRVLYYEEPSHSPQQIMGFDLRSSEGRTQTFVVLSFCTRRGAELRHWDYENNG
jgi:hypothetical protein